MTDPNERQKRQNSADRSSTAPTSGAVGTGNKNTSERVAKKKYPRRPSPIPEEQLAKDRELSRRLYRILYALPFLVVAIAFVLYLLTRP